jgi:hypothetical protein
VSRLPLLCHVRLHHRARCATHTTPLLPLSCLCSQHSPPSYTAPTRCPSVEVALRHPSQPSLARAMIACQLALSLFHLLLLPMQAHVSAHSGVPPHTHTHTHTHTRTHTDSAHACSRQRCQMLACSAAGGCPSTRRSPSSTAQSTAHRAVGTAVVRAEGAATVIALEGRPVLTLAAHVRPSQRGPSPTDRQHHAQTQSTVEWRVLTLTSTRFTQWRVRGKRGQKVLRVCTTQVQQFMTWALQPHFRFTQGRWRITTTGMRRITTDLWRHLFSVRTLFLLEQHSRQRFSTR